MFITEHAQISGYPLESLIQTQNIFSNSLAYFSTIDVHVISVLPAFTQRRPIIAMNVFVFAFVSTLVTSHRTVGQHPAGILLALVSARPVGAVLVVVLAAGFDPWFLCWFWGCDHGY